MLTVLPSNPIDRFSMELSQVLGVEPLPWDLEDNYTHHPHTLVITLGGVFDDLIPEYCKMDIVDIIQQLNKQGRELSTKNIADYVRRCYGEWVR